MQRNAIQNHVTHHTHTHTHGTHVRLFIDSKCATTKNLMIEYGNQIYNLRVDFRFDVSDLPIFVLRRSIENENESEIRKIDHRNGTDK